MPHFTSGKWPDHRYKCPSWRKAGQEWLLGFFDAVWLSPYQTPPARIASEIPIHPCRFMTTMQVHLYYILICVCVETQSIWHCMLWCYMFVWRIGKLTCVTIMWHVLLPGRSAWEMAPWRIPDLMVWLASMCQRFAFPSVSSAEARSPCHYVDDSWWFRVLMIPMVPCEVLWFYNGFILMSFSTASMQKWPR